MLSPALFSLASGVAPLGHGSCPYGVAPDFRVLGARGLGESCLGDSPALGDAKLSMELAFSPAGPECRAPRH